MPARNSFAIITLLLVGGGTYTLGKAFVFSSAEKSSAIETVEVVTQDIEEAIKIVGEVGLFLATDIKSEVSGRIVAVHVAPGDHVEKNEVLIELDRSELETQLQEASLEIEASRLALERIKLDHDSKKDLYQKGFVSERDFKDASIDLALALNELEIQKSRADLLQSKLAKTTIRATHLGIVLGDELNVGMVITGASSVSKGDLLMEVAQLNPLLVETEISEIDLHRIHLGMGVELSFDSLPDATLLGTITFISPAARPRSSPSSSSGSPRVFPITVSFSAEQVRVHPGMTAHVSIVLQAVEGTLAAKLPALFVEGGENIVYAKKGDSFDRRVIDIGISDRSFFEIKSGLKEGDLLATSRPDRFRE